MITGLATFAFACAGIAYVGGSVWAAFRIGDWAADHGWPEFGVSWCCAMVFLIAVPAGVAAGVAA